MKNRLVLRTLLVTAFAAALVALATPAQAQQATLRGKVVDREGKPVADATITFDFVGDYDRQFTSKTDAKGTWLKAGLNPGRYNIKVVKGDLVGKANGIIAAIGQILSVQDIIVGPPGNDAVKTTTMSAEEVAKRNKHQAELEALFKGANDAYDAGNYDDALAKFTQISTEMEKCASCFSRIGDTYVKKGDQENAEKAYLKALEIDPNHADTYTALSSLYNSQKKFDEATKMSAKASELAGPGGGDANSIFNQGIILWNQSKIPEAKALFQKAVELDPKHAEAHYWLGMSWVNEGKLTESKKDFEEYLKLAPTGQYADTAKAILATIK
jgi:tetratricopeptide (TPR) repeat protein